MNETVNTALLLFTFSVKFPLMSLMVPFPGAPFSTTLAPIIASPDGSVTIPVTFTCAQVKLQKHRRNKVSRNRDFPSTHFESVILFSIN